MTTMSVLVSLLVASAAEPAQIASVNFEKIKPVLTEWAFSKPEHAELKERRDAMGKHDPLSLMRTDEQGNMVFSKRNLKQTAQMMSRFEVQKAVKDVLRRELILIIDGMGPGYALVLNSHEQNALLFSRMQIEDITQKVYQEIVRKVANREPAKAKGKDAER